MEGINTGFVSREPREGCGKYCFGLGHNAHCGPSAKPPPRTARLRRAASPFTQEETQEKKQNHEREREREREEGKATRRLGGTNIVGGQEKQR